mgnify:CR=1 FL=1
MQRAKYTGGSLEKPPNESGCAGIRGENGVKHAGKSGRIRLHGALARPHKYEGLEIR